MLRWRAFPDAKTLKVERGEHIDVLAESLRANSAAHEQARLLEPVERRKTSVTQDTVGRSRRTSRSVRGMVSASPRSRPAR